MDIPKIGFGTHQLNSVTCREYLSHAFKCGYQHLDCAHRYMNESVIGENLESILLDSNESVKREDIFITGKLPINGLAEDKVSYFFDKSSSALRTKYLDLYLIHGPFSAKYLSDDEYYAVDKQTGLFAADESVDFRKTWAEMEKLHRRELVKHIGLSNFNKRQMEEVLEKAEIRPKVLQIEVHGYLQQKELREFCRDEKIIVEAFAPIGSPVTAAELGKKVLINDPIINEIATKHKKSASQVALRWLRQMDVIPIVSAVTKEQMAENIRIDDFKLDEDDLKAIDGLDCGMRVYYLDDVKGVRDHPQYPFEK
ncbi:aldo-keto reductase 1B-like [Brevipalpus obovatus]|uniref:aldo-keto reductase 1B-like n=1 Tax=Brevipalpus obovatus TaxID=246614 RepID=UPI003D9F2758